MTKEIIENDPYKLAGVDIDQGNNLIEQIKEDLDLGIGWSTGSLGHGLSASMGIAYSEKLKNIRSLHQNNRRCEINPGCQNCRHGMKKRGVTYVPDEWNLETMKWENHTWRNG